MQESNSTRPKGLVKEKMAAGNQTSAVRNQRAWTILKYASFCLLLISNFLFLVSMLSGENQRVLHPEVPPIMAVSSFDAAGQIDQMSVIRDQKSEDCRAIARNDSSEVCSLKPEVCENNQFLSRGCRVAAYAAGAPKFNQLSVVSGQRSEKAESCELIADSYSWLDALIDALIWQECSGRIRDTPAGDNGKAVGCLQIHECVIEDVNRFYRTAYSLEDRNDPEKSRQICRLYVARWMDVHKEEIAARIWNGGPRGWERVSTVGYWADVQEKLVEVKIAKN